MNKVPTPAILGLDLAERLGISVLSLSGPCVLWSSTVQLAKRMPGERLIRLKQLLHEVFARFTIVETAIEDVFLPAKTSRKTPISLGELRGVARLCAAEQGIPVFFYPPAQVKVAITGSGRADKAQISRWIEREFKLQMQDDNEADAISIAYTHWLYRRFQTV